MICLTLTACAIGAPDPGVAKNSDKAKKFTDVGVEYFKSGDNVNALNWLKKALQFDIKYAKGHSILGTVFQSEKQWVLAETYFKKSIQLEPDSAMFHNNYGVFLYQLKRYKEACEQLELATKDPFYNLRANALNNLGRCYTVLNEEDKASDAFQRSVNLGGGDGYALLNLAHKLLDSGENFKSQEKYNEFLDLIALKQAQHTAESLILGIKLARVSGNLSDVVTYSLLLENLFPNKYKKYKESAQ
jgi:type IV pilus assembly protein PilF